VVDGNEYSACMKQRWHDLGRVPPGLMCQWR